MEFVFFICLLRIIINFCYASPTKFYLRCLTSKTTVLVLSVLFPGSIPDFSIIEPFFLLTTFPSSLKIILPLVCSTKFLSLFQLIWLSMITSSLARSLLGKKQFVQYKTCSHFQKNYLLNHPKYLHKSAR